MRSLRVVLVTLIAAAAAVATSASAPALASHAAKTTRLTISIRGCDGCHVSLVPGDEFLSYKHIPRRATVAGGKVTFSVPTDETRGLEVTVDDPKAADVDAATYVVFRYQGQRAGTRVKARRSATEKKGFVCSAGTTRPTLHWTFRVVHYPVTGVTGEKGYSDRIYGNPGVRKFGDLRPLHRGAFLMNGDNYCADADR